MRRFVPILLAGVIVFSAAGCGTDLFGDDDNSGRPFKILQIVPLSGNYESIGRDHKRAVELAVDKINSAGGVDGRRLEVVFRDDKSTPDQSVANFNELKGSVDAVIGSAFSNCALATVPLVDKEKIPYLSLAPADEQVTPAHPYVFVVPAISSMYAERQLQYFQGAGIRRIAVAYDTRSSYASAGFKAMEAKAAQYGVTIVSSQQFQTGTTDFAPALTAVRNSGAQVFAVWATGPPAIAITKQFRASGTTMPLALTGAQASRLFLDPAGAAAEGVIMTASIGVVGPYLDDGPLKESIGTLSRSFRGLYRYAPPQFAQDGYSAVHLLAAAVDKAGSTDRDKVRDALERIKLVTPNGVYAYSGTDHSGLSTDYIAVVKVNGGSMVPTDWATAQFAGLTGR